MPLENSIFNFILKLFPCKERWGFLESSVLEVFLPKSQAWALDTFAVLLRDWGVSSCCLHCHGVVFQGEKPVSPLGFRTSFSVANSMLLLGCFTCLNFILKAWLNLIRWLHEQQMNCVFLLFRGMQPRILFYMEILIVRAHSRVRFQHTEEVSSPKSLKRKWLSPTMKLHWTFTTSNKDIVLKKRKKKERKKIDLTSFCLLS